MKEDFKVIVLNLTPIINKEHIKEIFGSFGSIKYVEVISGIVSIYTGPGLSSKAFISFCTKEGGKMFLTKADAAVSQMNYGVIDQVRVRVRLLNNRPVQTENQGSISSFKSYNRGRYPDTVTRYPPGRSQRSPPPRRNRQREKSPRRSLSPRRRSLSPAKHHSQKRQVLTSVNARSTRFSSPRRDTRK